MEYGFYQDPGPLQRDPGGGTAARICHRHPLYEQINLFSALEGGGIQVERTPVSPFAAQQDELARLLFSASAVGSYALQQVDSLLERAQTPEEVLELIRQTGPGYQRFRLYERYHELKREQG